MIYFVHISDLHFGEKLANSGRGLIPHQRPHNLAKCLGLPSGINLAIDEAEMPDDAAFRVIASGDLSVSGATQELAVAHAFLRSRVPISRLPAPYGVMGLDIPSDLLGSIPGNHDHWNGNRTTLRPHNSNLFDEQFRSTPWVKEWKSHNNDFDLDVFGVDTNSGWNPDLSPLLLRKRAGLLSHGRISDQEFNLLEQKLSQSVAKRTQTVRAIVCHHSISYRGGRLGKLELDPASRDRLLQLSEDYHVAVVLTGHTHDSHYHLERRSDQQGNIWGIHELRCASTVGWPEGSKDESGFLFHRVTCNGTDWVWTVWRFGWDGNGYVSAPNPWQKFSGAF